MRSENEHKELCARICCAALQGEGACAVRTDNMSWSATDLPSQKVGLRVKFFRGSLRCVAFHRDSGISSVFENKTIKKKRKERTKIGE